MSHFTNDSSLLSPNDDEDVQLLPIPPDLGGTVPNDTIAPSLIHSETPASTTSLFLQSNISTGLTNSVASENNIPADIGTYQSVHNGNADSSSENNHTNVNAGENLNNDNAFGIHGNHTEGRDGSTDEFDTFPYNSSTDEGSVVTNGLVSSNNQPGPRSNRRFQPRHLQTSQSGRETNESSNYSSGQSFVVSGEREQESLISLHASSAQLIFPLALSLLTTEMARTIRMAAMLSLVLMIYTHLID